jgi:septum formation protein
MSGALGNLDIRQAGEQTVEPQVHSGRPVLVLASGSPRRYALIRRFFPAEQVRVIAPDFDESLLMKQRPDQSPDHLVARLAEGKLDAMFRQHAVGVLSVAIAADTIVTLDRRILGKPTSADDAADMLRHLSGRTHAVMTGLSVRLTAGDRVVARTVVETTTVTFGPLDESMIHWYLASGEPFDKAGAYGIQGLGAAFISRIDGCYYNVMGLPVYRLFAVLRELAAQTGSDHLRSFVSTMNGQSL